jgi:uncharacterized protein
MFIDLAQLEQDGLRVDYQYPAGFPDLQDANLTLISPCAITVNLQRRGHDIDANVRVTATIGATCDRCLAPTVIAIDSSFNAIFLPLERLNETEELILERQELDFSFYKENRIDLDDLVREQIQLALPMSNLCREDCLGLCRHCGQNLNISACQCKDESIDPRWSALLELKKKIN